MNSTVWKCRDRKWKRCNIVKLLLWLLAFLIAFNPSYGWQMIASTRITGAESDREREIKLSTGRSRLVPRCSRYLLSFGRRWACNFKGFSKRWNREIKSKLGLFKSNILLGFYLLFSYWFIHGLQGNKNIPIIIHLIELRFFFVLVLIFFCSGLLTWL